MPNVNAHQPVLCEIAEAMGKRIIMKSRCLRGLTKVSFVYGLSDETTIVASRPLDKAFNHWEHFNETFEDVWKRLSIDDQSEEGMQ